VKRVIVAAVVLFPLLACGKSMFTSVDGVMLAEADAVVPPADGPRVLLAADPAAPAPPVPAGAKVVQIGAHRDLPWANVRDYVRQVREAGATPVLLVGDGKGGLAAMPPTADAISRSLLVEAEVDGRACMSPPDAAERQCGQSPATHHIDRVAVRQVTRTGVVGFGLEHVHVRPDPGLSWADTVRTLDGVRTCCKKDVKIVVSLEDVAL
jgi:hypothetical protein